MTALIARIQTPSGTLTQTTVEEARTAGASEDDIARAAADAALSALKKERSARLEACDWTMITDAPLSAAQKTAWREYRTALRNLPATLAAAKVDLSVAINDPAIWPTQPVS